MKLLRSAGGRSSDAAAEVSSRQLDCEYGRWACQRLQGPPFTKGITETPVSNPLRPRASLGKVEPCHQQKHRPVAVPEVVPLPVAKSGSVSADLQEAAADHDQVQQDIRHADGQPDPNRRLRNL